MTREKYESLPLSTLKALAKSRNMKGISTLRKEALIERMLEEDQKENQKNMEEPAVLKEEKKTETVQDQNQEPQEKREDGMERQNRETSENGTARLYQRPRYVRREERSENGERQEYRPRAPRFNERRFQEPRNYNQNNREEEQRQEPCQEAGQEMRQEPLRQEARPETRQEPRQETSTLDSGQEACGILEGNTPTVPRIESRGCSLEGTKGKNETDLPTCSKWQIGLFLWLEVARRDA